MRVAQIIETMAMGGAENLALHVAGALADRGHESHLIVIEDPGVLSAKVPAGVEVHHLGFHRASIRNPFRFATVSRLDRPVGLGRREGVGTGSAEPMPNRSANPLAGSRWSSLK